MTQSLPERNRDRSVPGAMRRCNRAVGCVGLTQAFFSTWARSFGNSAFALVTDLKYQMNMPRLPLSAQLQMATSMPDVRALPHFAEPPNSPVGASVMFLIF